MALSKKQIDLKGIFEILLWGFQQRDWGGGKATLQLPKDEELDPERFNRAILKIDGRSYGVSVFESSEPAGVLPIKEEPLELTQAIDEPVKFSCPPVFDRDHRENVKLHRLYVRYAIEELTVVNDFLETMTDFSRVSASIITQPLIEAVQME